MSSLENLFIAATNRLRAGQRDAARADFARILAQWPNCHEAMYMSGLIAADSGEWSQSERHFRDALGLDPGNPEYLFRLGTVLLRLRRSEEACAALEQAAAETDDFAPLFITLGRARQAARRFAAAAEAYRRALDLDTSALDAHRGLITCLLAQRGKASEAIEACRAYAAADPQSAEPYARQAEVYERANQLDEARSALDRALALDADCVPALLVQAELEQRAGRLALARTALERAIAHAQQPDIRRAASKSLGHVLDRQGEPERALKYIEASKRPIEEIPPAFRRQAEKYRAYLGALGAVRNGTSVAPVTDPAAPGELESPVFFVGFPRSGTTLLEQMLGSHTRFIPTDEPPSLGIVREVLAESAGGPERVPAALSLLTPSDLKSLRERYWSDMSRHLRGQSLSGRRLLDKHPMNTANLVVARALFPHAKVVMSIRDPRDVCLSCFMTFTRSPMGATFFATVESAAEIYAATMDQWLRDRERLGMPWIQVRYEEIVADARGTLGRVLAFLGEPWEEGVMNYAERAASKHIRTASYQQVTQDLYTRSIGRWNRYRPFLGRAEQILAPYVAAFGYQPSDSTA